MLRIVDLPAAVLSNALAALGNETQAKSEILCSGQPGLLSHLYVFSTSSSMPAAFGEPLRVGGDLDKDYISQTVLGHHDHLDNAVDQFVRHFQSVTPKAHCFQQIFYSCESNYMNYTPVHDLGDGITQYYGSVLPGFESHRPTNRIYPYRQVRLARTGGCLTVDSDSHAINLKECSTTDDISQTNQFWRTTSGSDGAVPLSFVGNITNGGRDAYYSIEYANEVTSCKSICH